MIPAPDDLTYAGMRALLDGVMHGIHRKRRTFYGIDIARDTGSMAVTRITGKPGGVIVIDDFVQAPFPPPLHAQRTVSSVLFRQRWIRRTWRGKTFVYWVPESAIADHPRRYRSLP